MVVIPAKRSAQALTEGFFVRERKGISETTALTGDLRVRAGPSCFATHRGVAFGLGRRALHGEDAEGRKFVADGLRRLRDRGIPPCLRLIHTLELKHNYP